MLVKFAFSRKATKIDKIFTVDLTVHVSVKLTVRILSNFVAFLENTNFNGLGGGTRTRQYALPLGTIHILRNHL